MPFSKSSAVSLLCGNIVLEIKFIATTEKLKNPACTFEGARNTIPDNDQSLSERWNRDPFQGELIARRGKKDGGEDASILWGGCSGAS